LEEGKKKIERPKNGFYSMFLAPPCTLHPN